MLHYHIRPKYTHKHKKKKKSILEITLLFFIIKNTSAQNTQYDIDGDIYINAYLYTCKIFFLIQYYQSSSFI